MFLVPVCIHITATVTPDGSADFCCLLVLLRHRQCLSAGISPKIIVQFSANLVRTVLAADRRSRGKRPGNARNRSAIYRNSKTIC